MALMRSIEMLAGLITILAIDFKGDLIDIKDRLGSDRWLHYHVDHDFHLGLGPPPDCGDQVSWINHITKLLAATLGLQYGEACLAAGLRIGSYLMSDPATKTLGFCSLLLLEQLLERLPWRLIAQKEAYKQSALDRVSYLRRISGGLLSAEQGWDVTSLTRQHKCAVITAPNLPPILRQILVNLIALKLLFPRLVNRQVSSITNFLLVVDESDDVASHEASIIYPEEYSPLGNLLKQGREFGISVALGMNSMAKCSPTIRSNVSYHFVMNQEDPASIATAAETLLEFNSRRLIGSLERGKCIYKEGMGPVPYGMLAKIDYVPPSTAPMPTAFDTHPFTPARSMEEIPGFMDRLKVFLGKHQQTEQRQKAVKSKSPLNANHRKFLDLMSLYEYEPLQIAFDRMGSISSSTQQQILKRLTQLTLIVTQRVRSEGLWLRFGQITEKGWELLDKQSQCASLHGGPDHTSLCWMKHRHDLAKGFEKSIFERPYHGLSGKSDLASFKNGRWYATEVVVECNSNIAKHVRDCFGDPDIERLTIVTLLKSEHRKLRDMILSESDLVFYIDRIDFITAAQIYKELYAK